MLSCTLALFLSGYVIQQRTLRDLREAIRPRTPRPATKPHLPDRFKGRIGELEDGTFIFLESEAEEEARYGRAHVVEISKSVSESTESSSSRVDASSGPIQGKPTPKQLAILEEITTKMNAKKWAVENPDPFDPNMVPMDAAERRQMIREEIQRLATSNELVYYHKNRQ